MNEHTTRFLRCFRDPIRVPRIENRVPSIIENYQRVHQIRENRVPRIREIRTLEVHTGYPTFSLNNAILLRTRGPYHRHKSTKSG